MEIAAPIPRVPPVTNATRAIRFAPELLFSVYQRSQDTFLLSPLQAHRDAHTAANAECGQALVRVAALHFVKKRHEDPGTRGADWMPDRDRTTIHVHLRSIPTHVLVHRACLRRERLVRLDQIEIGRLPPGPRESTARRRNRSGAHHLRIDAGLRPRFDRCESDKPALVGFLRAHQYKSRGAVIDSAGIARGYGTILLERRLQRCDTIIGRALADILIRIDHALALSLSDGDRNDFVPEFTGLTRSLGLVLRRNRETILLFARDLPFPSDVLGGDTHVVAVECVKQAVFQHRVGEIERTHLSACAQIGGVWRLSHRLLTT